MKIYRRISADMDDHSTLAEYWENNQLQTGGFTSPPCSPAGSVSSVRDVVENQPRNRAGSCNNLPSTLRQSLPPFHPALSLMEFVDTFGPLIFPLYRAALLRKRILMVSDVPVELPCNFGIYPKPGCII